jgi:hypothetical protein
MGARIAAVADESAAHPGGAAVLVRAVKNVAAEEDGVARVQDCRLLAPAYFAATGVSSLRDSSGSSAPLTGWMSASWVSLP